MKYQKEDSITAYFKDIADIPILTRKQEAELAQWMENGDESAAEDLFRHNLRFVVETSKKYAHTGVLPFSDIISEGNQGLRKAIEHYDYRKGSLPNYARWWIKQFIMTAIQKYRGLNSSGTIYHALNKLEEEALNLSQGISFSEALKKAIERTYNPKLKKNVDQVKALLKLTQTSFSLESTQYDGVEGSSWKDFLVSHYPQPETSVRSADSNSLRKDLQPFFEKLPERWVNILRHRFGLDGEHPKTLDEIALMYNLTREAIRQIQNRALNKLRTMDGIETIRHYLE